MADDMLSSPDPLNDSPTFHRPFSSKARQQSPSRRSLPPQSSSPTKQMFELDVGRQLSPHKIRVTVEAGDSDIYADYPNTNSRKRRSILTTHAPRSRQSIQTTTTTIPLKGLSDSEYEFQSTTTPKRGRGRPRKSPGTPVPSKKRGRPSTPTPKANNRRSSLLDLVDDDSSAGDFGIGSNIEIGRRKATSRPRAKKGTPRKSTPAAEKQVDLDTHISTSAKKGGRPRRKTFIPEDVQVLEDRTSDTSLPDAANETADLGGALRSINPNSPSKSSTARPIATNGADEDDVLIAKFYPGFETPRKAGWSSPKVVEDQEIPNLDFDIRSRSPIPRQFPSSSHSGNQRFGSKPQSTQRQLSPSSEDGSDGGQLNGDDGAGETGRYDTIMMGEEFSMISVESVSSLWANRTDTGNEIQANKPAELSTNPSLLPRQHVGADVRKNNFEEVLDDPSETAASQSRAQDIRLLSARNAQAEEPFFSISSQALKAASPAIKPSLFNRLSNDNSRLEDSFSDIEPEVLEAATPGKAPPHARAAAVKKGDKYEDSFSVIPSVVLDAATPATKRQESANLKSPGQEVSESGKLEVVGSNPNLRSSQAQNHSSPRLLTPEETPSPLLETLSSEPGSAGKGLSNPAGGITKERVQMEPHISRPQVPSSPPALESRRYTASAHLRQNHQLNPSVAETPYIIFSSPSLPPLMQQAKEEHAHSEASSESRRPTLSPIARAGRALQDLVVPPLPRSRSQSLGSPFNSPSNRSGPGVIQDGEQLPPQDHSEKQTTAFGQQNNPPLVSSRETALAHSHGRDDPFNSNGATESQRSISPGERSQYSLGLPEQRRLSDPAFTNRRSIPDYMQSDDAMSWQVDQEVSTDNNGAPMINTVNSSKNYNAPTGKSPRIMSTGISQTDGANSDEKSPEYYQEDDEDFNLLLETMNSPPVALDHPGPSESAAENFKHSRISSLWKQSSRRLVSSDELSHISSPTLGAEHTISGNILSGIRAKPAMVRRTEGNHKNRDDTNTIRLPKYQIPQKANFQPRARETEALDLSSLLGGSPGKPLPVLSTISGNIPYQVERDLESSQPLHIDREKMPSPVKGTLESKGSFTPIQQKQGFKPRARNEAPDGPEGFTPSPVKQPNSFFSLASKPAAPTASGGAPSSKPLAAKPFSTANIPLSHVTPPGAPSSPVYLYDGSSSVASNVEKENQDIANRTLQWTENVRLTSVDPYAPLSVSPTKSCLRSPLKAPFGNTGSSIGSPSKGVTFASSSPTPSSPAKPLSSTTWSQSHWLLLDAIVQAWKPQNQYITGSGSSRDGSESIKGRRNSTRVISRLLGRRVSSNGDSMILEQWHLEAVDEFRGQVPGWDEKVIALRVFSLLVGEERRLRAMTPDAGSF